VAAPNVVKRAGLLRGRSQAGGIPSRHRRCARAISMACIGSSLARRKGRQSPSLRLRPPSPPRSRPTPQPAARALPSLTPDRLRFHSPHRYKNAHTRDLLATSRPPSTTRSCCCHRRSRGLAKIPSPAISVARLHEPVRLAGNARRFPSSQERRLAMRLREKVSRRRSGC